MNTYSILIHPDKRLRTVAKAVTQFDDTLKTIISTMYDTMYSARGIGLAATQVNIHQRLIVMDVPKTLDDTAPSSASDKLTLINPEIIAQSDEQKSHQEGCLSIPEQFAEVTRPSDISIRYQDVDGQTHQLDADGLLAVCIQHEIDHLNGILFIDHLSRLKRQSLEKKLQKHLKQQNEQ